VEIFKLWSESNPDSLKTLKPNIGLRDWDELGKEEKNNIWLIMQNKNWFTKSFQIYETIIQLNEKYKYKCFGTNLLSHGGPHYYATGGRDNCCNECAFKDFDRIFFNEKQDVVFETISIFSKLFINKGYFYDNNGIIKDEITKDSLDKAYSRFDQLAYALNDIFNQYGINVILIRTEFILKQDEKITKDIYEPVLNFLSNPKWDKVTEALRNGFLQYQMNNPDSYSSCITYGINAIQAYLQIIVFGDVGKGDIKDLLITAQTKNLIPNDKFSHIIFKDLEAFFMSERQLKGTPHPSKEYATEKNARLLLNLVMVFLQHCIQV
jgi:hypothetical protein